MQEAENITLPEKGVEVKKHNIAIIPAKGESERCPGKNFRLIGGKPLFRYSVDYAIKEGFIPIVSTDSEDIIKYCDENNLNFFVEKVDDSSMLNCVNQVIDFVGVEKINNLAVLQPTSPMRKPGLLREAVSEMDKHGKTAAMSVTPYKLIGELNGKFNFATRDQDPKTKFFNFFDGNVLVSKAVEIVKNQNLFTDQDPVYVKNTFPCNIQIDTDAEFEVVKTLMEGVTFSSYVPEIKKTKKVVIVSNKCDLTRDYSEFIDSCDEVLRCNRANNLDTKLVGNKVTMWLIAAYWNYERYDPEARHRDKLYEAREVLFIPEIGNTSESVIKEFGLKNAKFLGRIEHGKTINYTTITKLIAVADQEFPDAQLYFLGDIDTNLRVPNSTKHNKTVENIFIDTLIKKGRLIVITEEDKKDNYIYSKPVSLNVRWKTIDQCLLFGSEKEITEVLTIALPDGMDKLRVYNSRCCREINPKATLGDIVQRNENNMIIHFDSYGYAKFIKKEKNGCETWFLDIGREYGTQEV